MLLRKIKWKSEIKRAGEQSAISTRWSGRTSLRRQHLSSGLRGGEKSSAGLWGKNIVGRGNDKGEPGLGGTCCVHEMNRRVGSRVLRGRAVRRQGQRKHGGGECRPAIRDLWAILRTLDFAPKVEP